MSKQQQGSHHNLQGHNSIPAFSIMFHVVDGQYYSWFLRNETIPLQIYNRSMKEPQHSKNKERKQHSNKEKEKATT